MKIMILPYLFLLITISANAQQSRSGWTLVFRNDASGAVLFGDKQELIHAVRSGYQVRVGWGHRHPEDDKRSVEHVADAGFLTILSGTEVLAQIDPIVGQRPDYENGLITFREGNSWVQMANTNGKAVQLMRDYTTGKVLETTQRPTGFTWYVNYPPGAHDGPEPKPLW